MKLSDMKEILAARRIQLTKSLGQNFLHDANQLRRITAAAELRRSDRVLEIGPGLGPLTELLLAQAGHVLAMEKDRRLVDVLAERFASVPNLELLHADALRFLQENRRDWSEWKVVSNLPYSVASPILVELAGAPGCPERMVVTLQIEVAQRILASAGNKDYGVLTLLLQQRYAPAGWFKIPAACFFPPPDVDSACINLARRPEPLLSEEEAGTFSRIVKRAFSQRRKMMLKLLKQDWTAEKLARAFERAGLSARVRAEQVTLEQFVELTRQLA